MAVMLLLSAFLKAASHCHAQQHFRLFLFLLFLNILIFFLLFFSFILCPDHNFSSLPSSRFLSHLPLPHSPHPNTPLLLCSGRGSPPIASITGLRHSCLRKVWEQMIAYDQEHGAHGVEEAQPSRQCGASRPSLKDFILKHS